MKVTEKELNDLGIQPFLLTAEVALRHYLENQNGDYYTENEWSMAKGRTLGVMQTIHFMETYANHKVAEALAKQTPPEPC